MLYHFLITIHVIACILMILVVLLQTGRGAGLSVFGGGGGDSLINTTSGSSFMKNFTSILAGTFAFTSLFLTLLLSRTGMSSVTSRVKAPAPMSIPSAPPTAPQAPVTKAPSKSKQP